ncbi:29effb58-6cc6-4fe2-8117-77e55d72f4ca [Sclerotinia trifoliorum]|uniref:29effb58-6cc6-4fe2-8117-77e55d72f4ca n=1 Tax=Sclerotinia trifoliorum TaxID=28548 RepID=A0A8H2ZSQ7_9HELO|nr:29effb58-6cc6-4fe2-8117-77e55d72f4ca [Sclerotinia trifoliorum]
MESRIERQNLDSNVSEQKLKILYSEMAGIVLEMSKPEFTHIGSLVQTENGYAIGRRPLTKYVNELAMKANLAPQHFPTSNSIYTTSVGYFGSLVEQHMAQLRNQRNDCVKDEDDCKKKYIARCLMLRISHYIAMKYSTGPFRLFCEDFRPSNIIANTEPFHINAVIDLEFTYAAPAAFTYSAPWWLLLQNPEEWELDLKGTFLPRYKPRLRLFLEALREVEEEQIKSEKLLEDQRLSGHMEKSMENGVFWFCLAIKNSQMFDDVYWTFLDEMFFGPLDKLEDRIQFLSEDEKNELQTLYEIKQKQANDGILDDVYDAGDQLDY